MLQQVAARKELIDVGVQTSPYLLAEGEPSAIHDGLDLVEHGDQPCSNSAIQCQQEQGPQAGSDPVKSKNLQTDTHGGQIKLIEYYRSVSKIEEQEGSKGQGGPAGAAGKDRTEERGNSSSQLWAERQQSRQAAQDSLQKKHSQAALQSTPWRRRKSAIAAKQLLDVDEGPAEQPSSSAEVQPTGLQKHSSGAPCRLRLLRPASAGKHPSSSPQLECTGSVPTADAGEAALAAHMLASDDQGSGNAGGKPALAYFRKDKSAISRRAVCHQNASRAEAEAEQAGSPSIKLVQQKQISPPNSTAAKRSIDPGSAKKESATFKRAKKASTSAQPGENLDPFALLFAKAEACSQKEFCGAPEELPVINEQEIQEEVRRRMMMHRINCMQA